MATCKALTKRDKQPCRRPPSPGSTYCGLHGGKAVDAAAGSGPLDGSLSATVDPVDDSPLASFEGREDIERHLDVAPNSKFRPPDDWFVGCTKCGGEGEYQSRSSSYAGTCSACHGSGRTFRKGAKKLYRAAKAHHAESAREDVMRDIASDHELTEALVKVIRDAEEHASEGVPAAHVAVLGGDIRYPAFTHDIAFKILGRGSWSPKQRDALVRVVKEADEPPRDRAPAPDGKATAAVKILKAKSQESYYYNKTDYKMLVEHEDGWRAWCTVPKALADDVEHLSNLRGVTITLEASFSPKQDDPSFAIAKRPKATHPPGWESSESPVGLTSWASQEGYQPEETDAAYRTAKERYESELHTLGWQNVGYAKDLLRGDPDGRLRELDAMIEENRRRQEERDRLRSGAGERRIFT